MENCKILIGKEKLTQQYRRVRSLSYRKIIIEMSFKTSNANVSFQIINKILFETFLVMLLCI